MFIDEYFCPRVFEMFFQLKSDRQRNGHLIARTRGKIFFPGDPVNARN